MKAAAMQPLAYARGSVASYRAVRERFIWLLITLALPTHAANPNFWEMHGFTEFAKGRFTNISLTADGRLRPAPRMDNLLDSGQPVVWSLARHNNTVYAATGHQGQIFRIEGTNSKLYWTAPEPEIFALTVGSNGVLYAGTSPDGKIYRIENGAAKVYFEPKTKYIWSLMFGADKALYAGTGDSGVIFRITTEGQGEPWYSSGQSHITSLGWNGALLAGSEPNGILYRITEKEKGFVLYDANMPEIRAMAVAADGSIYLATLGGASGVKPAGAAAATATPTVTAPAISITITEDGAAASQLPPKPAEPAKPAATAPAPPVVASTPMADYSGVDRSALILIHPDNLIETLWSSKEENIYDLAISDKRILFSTDQQGRVYSLDAGRHAELLVETKQGEATRLLSATDGVLVATSHMGRLLKLSNSVKADGIYESPIHDAGAAARWGRLVWRGSPGLVFYTRSGNSARPDKTWSDWSPELKAVNTPVASPNARYIQWKAELRGDVELESVTVAYASKNAPPLVKSVTATAFSSPLTKPSAQGSSTTVYSVTVTDTPQSQSTSAGAPTQTLTRAHTPQILLNWQAEDSDGDKLTYTVFARGEGEREWKKLKASLADPNLTLEADAFADGRYLFKVVASDEASNAPGEAREGEFITAPVWLDNTPPVVKVNVNGQDFSVNASDSGSPLKRAEYSIDAGPFITLACEDGVCDSKDEVFRGKLSKLDPGEHILVVRAIDIAGNVGVARSILR